MLNFFPRCLGSLVCSLKCVPKTCQSGMRLLVVRNAKKSIDRPVTGLELVASALTTSVDDDRAMTIADDGEE